MKKADIGVIGLAVMGQNLILNMNDHGYKVAAYNRSTAKVDEFLQGAAKGTQIIGAHSLQELADTLEKPRIIMLMVRAGDAVDQTVAQLLPYLEPGDIIIDGGNSHYPDTNRRVAALREQGSNADAWPHVKPILQAIAAKTKDGEPCCDWVGADGAGHFVKMVHNGIEYGDMQLICEAYHILKDGLGLTYPEMHAVFADWKKTELDSYLIDITADILAYKDEDGAPLVEKILDTAGQKGTGKWTGINALDHGIPLTLITEAVFARCVSALKDQREAAAQTFGKSIARIDGDRAAWTETLRQALLAAKIISYAQGFMLIREACIIRSRFLGDIRDAYAQNPGLAFLGNAPYFQQLLQTALPHWRKTVAKAIEAGIPVPCMASALTFLDGYTSARLPANLLQAQRDYFGAHTYERTDRPRGEYFHTNWTGKGGDTASTTYDV